MKPRFCPSSNKAVGLLTALLSLTRPVVMTLAAVALASTLSFAADAAADKPKLPDLPYAQIAWTIYSENKGLEKPVLAAHLQTQGIIADSPIGKEVTALYLAYQSVIKKGIQETSPFFADAVKAAIKPGAKPEKQDESGTASGGDGNATPTAFSFLETEDGSPLYTMLGTRTMAPFLIAREAPTGGTLTPETPGTIDSSSNRILAFVEVGYRSFWVTDAASKRAYPGIGIINAARDGDWNAFFRDDSTPKNTTSAGEVTKRFLRRGWDVEGRLSYTFTSEQKVSATTIVGSSEVYADLNVDKLFWYGLSGKRAWSVALGSRVAGGASRNDRRVHPDHFYGLRFNLGSPVWTGKKYQMSLLRIGVGAAVVDQLRTDPTSFGLKVPYQGSRPLYDQKTVPVIESEVWYPVSPSSSVRLGARLYDELDPNPWTISLGYTVDVGRVFKALSGFQDSSLPAEKK